MESQNMPYWRVEVRRTGRAGNTLVPNASGLRPSGVLRATELPNLSLASDIRLLRCGL